MTKAIHDETLTPDDVLEVMYKNRFSHPSGTYAFSLIPFDTVKNYWLGKWIDAYSERLLDCLEALSMRGHVVRSVHPIENPNEPWWGITQAGVDYYRQVVFPVRYTRQQEIDKTIPYWEMIIGQQEA